MFMDACSIETLPRSGFVYQTHIINYPDQTVNYMPHKNQDTPLHAAQETWGVQQTSVYFTEVKKMPFSHFCSSTLPENKQTNFSVQILLKWSMFDSEFKLNLLRYVPSKLILFSSYFFLLLLLQQFLKSLQLVHALLYCLEIWSTIGALLEHINYSIFAVIG